MAKVGEIIRISVVISTQNCMAFEIDLGYNKDLVSPIGSAFNHSFFQNSMITSNELTEGIIKISIAGDTNLPVNGEGVAFHIDFRAENDGSAEFVLANAKFVDVNNNEMPIGELNGASEEINYVASSASIRIEIVTE